MTNDPGSSEPSLIGEHYVVDRELGRGGMATVYLCTDNRTGARVAVKVLRQELESGVVTERFLREIAYSSELDHPRIPKVLDSGKMGELPYYVMTYVEGESLKKRLEREAQLPIGEALRIACEVIEPTAYAHSKGIVHRDIKPDNILLAADGVYVLDFGIARAIIESGVDRLTSTGIGVGTPAYMSPEQALGDRNLDARSDIYSIGCVVYEMIAGIPPFVGPTAQVIISRRFAASAPPLREVRQGVPDSVEEAIAKALARAPADRWATADEFGNALRAGATDTLSTGRFGGLARKSDFSRIAVAAAIVVLVAVGGIMAWTRYRASPFEKSQTALRGWDLAAAEASLNKALAADSNDPKAQLWLAQVMMLRGYPTLKWRSYALHASDDRSRLDARDQLRSDAIKAFASGDFASSCQAFSKLAGLTLQNEEDFSATLAYADCLRTDPTVLKDPRSPSGYRFQSSWQLADSLYEGLLARNATSPRAYSVIVPKLQAVLTTDKAIYRRSASGPEKCLSLMAHASLVADTLSYVPYAIPATGAPWRTHDAQGLEEVVKRNRERLRGLAMEWVRLEPEGARAHETLAGILEASGEVTGQDLSAINEITAARKRASADPRSEGNYNTRVRLAASQVRLYLRIPRFDSAGVLADSILSWPTPSGIEAEQRDSALDYMIPIAALRGQGLRAMQLELAVGHPQRVFLPRKDSSAAACAAQVTLPAALVRDNIALDTYASFGGPADSVLAIANRLSEQLPPLYAEKQIPGMRRAILERPLTLAAPVVGPKPLAQLEPSSDLFVLALRALARGDRQGARVFLDSLTELHADFPAGEITMDAVYGETWLALALGDTATATRKLDNAAKGLSAALPTAMRVPAIAASLVRVMALRAELAARVRDSSVAKYWADAVVSLWGRGDSVTRPTLDKMRQLH